MHKVSDGDQNCKGIFGNVLGGTLKNKQDQLWMERTRLTLELRISTNGTYILIKNRIQSINNELATIEDDIETVIEKIDKIDL